MDAIIINNGDGFEVITDPCGSDELVVKIQNGAWHEEPRYIHVAVAGKHDRRAAIDALMDALRCLRDEPEAVASAPVTQFAP